MTSLHITNLSVKTADKEILKNISLSVNPGEIHVIMGPNGSGKSTLSKVLLGHPHYEITQGDILLNKKSIIKLSPDARSRAGLFLGFQNPQKIGGLSTTQFLRGALNAHKKENKETPLSVFAFKKELEPKATALHIKPQLIDRYLNDGFSGGEMKKMETLQLLVLQPSIAILDELDSGLDVDALKVVCDAIKKEVKERNMGIIVITHYAKILTYLQPTNVHIMTDGSIIKTGDANLAKEVEQKGYCAVCEDTHNHNFICAKKKKKSTK